MTITEVIRLIRADGDVLVCVEGPERDMYLPVDKDALIGAIQSMGGQQFASSFIFHVCPNGERLIKRIDWP